MVESKAHINKRRLL